ncbi:MAG: adenylate/guanylate cyclase domain-containing protein [Rhodospirillales bacterium]|nr:adenylate/guanylate cyclase domain-containing protein [Rhodospirillales bacterium]
MQDRPQTPSRRKPDRARPPAAQTGTAISGLIRALGELVSGATDRVTLPERVRRAIAVEQRHSEVVVGWVQMGLVLTFATLYSVAPKTFSADAPFAPVPWALGAYFCFTVVRLFLAYRDRLTAWILAVSVVIDMALLLVTIWSFHLQYGQPPAFYLKAPTVLYIFIFIALRALRFEAGYVLLAGAVAASGWLVLVVYAATFDPGGMPVTRDYVHYMTSASILWGAEFDKIISILIVTLILVAAIARARRVLVQALAEGEAARDLKRFFAPDIARRITGSDELVHPGEGEMRNAAALFVDMRGFTVLTASLDPGATMKLLAEYQARMVPVIQEHGGSIDKFLGDGIMASFGAARRSQTYAADALRAVDALIAEAGRWRAQREAAGLPAPPVGAAVATGSVVFGAVGDETRLEYTVIGEAVNLAAKLEKHTKVEKVRALTDTSAFALAQSQGYAPPSPKQDRRGVRVEGVAEPLDLVVLA